MKVYEYYTITEEYFHKVDDSANVMAKKVGNFTLAFMLKVVDHLEWLKDHTN